MFRLDPLDVMDETDTFRRAARVAAGLLASEWDREATEKAKKK